MCADGFAENALNHLKPILQQFKLFDTQDSCHFDQLAHSMVHSIPLGLLQSENRRFDSHER